MSEADAKVEETCPAAAAGGDDGSAATRLPTMFISHGGGPSFFLKGRDAARMADMGPGSKLEKSLKNLGRGLAPKALLVITAHWEANQVTVSTGTYKKLLFDYYGFPDYTYQLKWPAPGNPALSKRIQGLLRDAGIPSKTDTDRGFDHGVFIPMLLAYPDADIPTVAMSLRADLDAELHLKLGEALAPLRDEGVLIIGSGFSTHGFGARASREDIARGSQEFDKYLQRTVAADGVSAAERREGLVNWASAPGARLSHPREEHLLPLHVVVGAAGDDKGTCIYNHQGAGGTVTSMFRFE